MRGAAACLKVQLNNDEAFIENYIDNNEDDPIEVQYEQIAVFSLLSGYFLGRGAWDWLSKIGRPASEYTLIGSNIYEPAPSNALDDYVPPKMAMACFNEYALKAGLKAFREDGADNVDLPPNWGSLVDATPVNELQALIDANSGFNNSSFGYTRLTIDYQPATLTLHRCTAQEIADLFTGDHDPHVDVFDAVKEMLVGNWPTLDANGLSQAIYDQATDTIIFKSDFSILAVSEAA